MKVSHKPIFGDISILALYTPTKSAPAVSGNVSEMPEYIILCWFTPPFKDGATQVYKTQAQVNNNNNN